MLISCPYYLLGGKGQLQSLYQFWEIILFPGRNFNNVHVSEGLAVFSIFPTTIHKASVHRTALRATIFLASFIPSPLCLGSSVFLFFCPPCLLWAQVAVLGLFSASRLFLSSPLHFCFWDLLSLSLGIGTHPSLSVMADQHQSLGSVAVEARCIHQLLSSQK